jgi:hypothetical protein
MVLFFHGALLLDFECRMIEINGEQTRSFDH